MRNRVRQLLTISLLTLVLTGINAQPFFLKKGDKLTLKPWDVLIVEE